MRIERILAVVALVVVLALPAAAFAEGHGAEPGAAEHKPTGSAFIDIHRYDLGIYTLLVFGILLIILSKYAWGPFTEGLRKREASLQAVRDAAEQAAREADDVRKKLHAEFGQANDKIRALLEEARRDADELRAKERDIGSKEAAAERDRARREIDAAKDAALKEIYQESVQLAALMSSKALRRSMSAEDHSRLVEESLAELKAGPERN
jgi:F-type H+-transporting ATPase subunit b